MSDNESAGRISWDLAFAQCMRLMQFEKQQFMDAHKDEDSIDLFGEANFKVSEEYDKVYGKDRELLLYFDALVDSEPVDVKVIQRHKGCVEVSRDLDSNAGFW
jgi:hypothetical protein